MPKTTFWDPPQAYGWMLAHCPPSSEWGPGGNTGEIKVARKGTGHPTLKSWWPRASVLSNRHSLMYGLYMGLTFTLTHQTVLIYYFDYDIFYYNLVVAFLLLVMVVPWPLENHFRGECATKSKSKENQWSLGQWSCWYWITKSTWTFSIWVCYRWYQMQSMAKAVECQYLWFAKEEKGYFWIYFAFIFIFLCKRYKLN